MVDAILVKLIDYSKSCIINYNTHRESCAICRGGNTHCECSIGKIFEDTVLLSSKSIENYTKGAK